MGSGETKAKASFVGSYLIHKAAHLPSLLGPLWVPVVPSSSASPSSPGTTQVSPVSLIIETSGSTMNAANPWLATVSKGTKKRTFVQFLFTVLVPHGFLRLPAGSRVFFLLNTQFSFCFGFVSLLFQSLAGMWWWPARGYRAGCAPAPISILGLERIIQRGNAQKKQSVVLQIARISPLKSLVLHLCSVPLSSQGVWQL